MIALHKQRESIMDTVACVNEKGIYPGTVNYIQVTGMEQAVFSTFWLFSIEIWWGWLILHQV